MVVDVTVVVDILQVQVQSARRSSIADPDPFASHGPGRFDRHKVTYLRRLGAHEVRLSSCLRLLYLSSGD